MIAWILFLVAFGGLGWIFYAYSEMIECVDRERED